MSTAARKVLLDMNPDEFAVDPNAYETSDLLWDGSFDNVGAAEDPLTHYASDSGYEFGRGKLLGDCSITRLQSGPDAGKWELIIMAVSDVDPLVWRGKSQSATSNTAAGTYDRVEGTDATPTLEIGPW